MVHSQPRLNRGYHRADRPTDLAMTSHSTNLNRSPLVFGASSVVNSYPPSEPRSSNESPSASLSSNSMTMSTDQEMTNAYSPFLHSTRRPVTRSLARRQQSTITTHAASNDIDPFRSLPKPRPFSFKTLSTANSVQAMEAEDSVPSASKHSVSSSFNPARYPHIKIVHSKPLSTEQSSQKIYTNEKPCNLVTVLGNSQLTGRLPRRFAEVKFA